MGRGGNEAWERVCKYLSVSVSTWTCIWCVSHLIHTLSYIQSLPDTASYLSPFLSVFLLYFSLSLFSTPSLAATSHPLKSKPKSDSNPLKTFPKTDRPICSEDFMSISGCWSLLLLYWENDKESWILSWCSITHDNTLGGCMMEGKAAHSTNKPLPSAARVKAVSFQVYI